MDFDAVMAPMRTVTFLQNALTAAEYIDRCAAEGGLRRGARIMSLGVQCDARLIRPARAMPVAARPSNPRYP